MTTGALLYPAGYTFLDDNGVPVNAGKLYSYRSTTSTAQDLYTDSTLLVAVSNPVILNSAGRATSNGSTLCALYGNPASGFDYRLTLKTSADVTVWGPIDDIVVDGADTVTIAEGSFTATLTGMTASTTATATYRVFANSSGTGKSCNIRLAASLTGTSNTTALTMTGLPAACTPTVAVYQPTLGHDNGVNVIASASIAASGTTITFGMGAGFSATGWTNSGNKGLAGGWNLTFPL